MPCAIELHEIDWDNVAEEIESLGRSQRREIRSRLEVILLHLLKLAYQRDEHSLRLWGGTATANTTSAKPVVE
jgi:hypothetical protein